MASASGPQGYTNFPDPESRGDLRSCFSAAGSATRRQSCRDPLVGRPRILALASAAICCRHMPKGCASVDQARNPEISAGRPGSAPRDKGGGPRRNRNRATRLAGTFKSRPTNATILTCGKAGIRPPLLQRGFLSRSRGRGDGGRLKSSRLIGQCIGCLAATAMPHLRRPPHSVFLLCARFCAGSMKGRGDMLGFRLAESETWET
jgi:hypothetical protein